jgi:hypothetical protein
VLFTPNGATVIYTPLNGVVGVVQDTVVTGLPVNGSLVGASFAAGFTPEGNPGSSCGHALLTDFVTTGGDNTMWLMARTPYRSGGTGSAAVAPTVGNGFTVPVPGAASFATSGNIIYRVGESNPTQRVYGWQATAFRDGLTFLGVDFTPGQPVFNSILPPPFNGTVDGSGRYRMGAFSAPPGNGTDRSHFLADVNFGGITTSGRYQTWFSAIDPVSPNQPSTLQGSGFATIPTTLRNTGQFLGDMTIVDNDRPLVSRLQIIQGGTPINLNAPPYQNVLLQGPAVFRMRAEDFGVSAVPNEGSGTIRYPRWVLRPIANLSNNPGVMPGDYDFSTTVCPAGPVLGGDNLFYSELTVGTPGTLDVPCGEYRVIAWVEDRVGLVSLPSTSATGGNAANGFNGIFGPFEVRKFDSLTLYLRLVGDEPNGFQGTAPDPVHMSPERYQRWIQVVLGGPPNTAPGPGTPISPITYDRFVLFDAEGNGVFSLSVQNGDVFPCPGSAMWVSAKDPHHTLRRSVPLQLAGTPGSAYINSQSAAVLPISGQLAMYYEIASNIYPQVPAGPPHFGPVIPPGLRQMHLRLGDLNNDNVIGIADFGIWLNLWNWIYGQNDVTNMIAPPAGTHADMSGNKIVGVEDYFYIVDPAAYNRPGDPLVSSFVAKSKGPGDQTRITVEELLRNGVTEARRYDLNGDKWITLKELEEVRALLGRLDGASAAR